jgi:N-acetylglutamate synthase-like GNAT family acetyltransferase
MINIRKATQRDVPRILELYGELAGEKQKDPSDTTNQVFNQIISLPNQEFLVAEKDNFVAGTVFLQITPNLSHDARPWAVLENLVVDGRYRRQGIGRLLVEYALTRAREAGCYKVQLLSSHIRHEAHQFYRALGFDDAAIGFRVYFQ